MTFNTDDLDRLADYVAGLLEPTEEAAVATLVATDPLWASRYEQLVHADAMIGAELRSIGAAATDDVMPADVVARIETAFAGARDEVPGVVSLVDRRAGSGSVGGTRRGSAEVRQRRKRRAGLVAVGALAAAVAAVVGGSVVNGSLSAQDSGSPVAGAADQAVAPNSWSSGADAGSKPDLTSQESASALSDLSSVPVTSSDANYTWVTLPLAAGSPAARTGSATSTMREQVPAPFAALAAPAALRACLDAIDAVTKGTPDRAEFASYDGRPALVVVVVTSPTEQLVVAVGPACGPGNPDVRALRTVS